VLVTPFHHGAAAALIATSGAETVTDGSPWPCATPGVIISR
jgi:hypothetical protein